MVYRREERISRYVSHYYVKIYITTNIHIITNHIMILL